MSEVDKAYYEANKDKMIVATRKWQSKHQEALKSYQFKYKASKKAYIKIYNAYYRLFGKKTKGMTAEDMQNAVKEFVDKQRLINQRVKD